MRVLGIETSCDETAAAVVEDRTRVLSNRVSSQVEVHRPYGGVVPELASRSHIEMIEPIVTSALEKAGCTLDDIDAVGVTCGPGLVGSLLVGLSFAKAVAFVTGKPLVGVNHLAGHVRAAFIEDPEIEYPALALVVSGGHTALYLHPDEATYRLLAKTRDDAAGEAYDKVAKLLGLGYPGGPVIDRIAPSGDDRRVPFPLPKMSDGSLDFSFSGLKTSALRFAQSENLVADWHRHGTPPAVERSPADAAAPSHNGRTGAPRGPRGAPVDKGKLSAATPSQPATPPGEEEIPPIVRDLCSSFQRAVVRLLLDRTLKAARQQAVRSVILSGGVACNRRLRSDLSAACAEAGLSFHLPPPRYCTDNAAMIASAAFVQLDRGETADLGLNADPGLRLGGPEAARKTLRHR